MNSTDIVSESGGIVHLRSIPVNITSHSYSPGLFPGFHMRMVESSDPFINRRPVGNHAMLTILAQLSYFLAGRVIMLFIIVA